MFHQRVPVDLKLGLPRKDQLENPVDLRHGAFFILLMIWLFFLLC